MVEQRTENPRVGSSILPLATIFFPSGSSLSEGSVVNTDSDSDTQRCLRLASQRLDSRLEAEILLAHTLGRNRSWLYAHSTNRLGTAQMLAFNELVERRLAGEPIAYLVGKREFFGRDFLVSKDVLIPRPETEHLVEKALELPLPARARVVDVGTGSGCIALTLAAERPAWQVIGADLSPPALALADLNRRLLDLERVELINSDLLAELQDRKFDLIISNPPYVATGDPHLDQGDLRFEPAMALACDGNGLDLIKRLIEQAAKRLASGGWLIIEHGHEQGEPVAKLFQHAGFGQIETATDLAGLPRLTLARIIHELA